MSDSDEWNFADSQPKSRNVCVAVRFRPFSSVERESEWDGSSSNDGGVGGGGCCSSPNSLWTLNNPEDACVRDNLKGSTFMFDHAFDGNASNEEIFDQIAKDIVHSCLRGVNGSIFAYGQTSSGKTYTMLGDENQTVPGVILLAVEEIFNVIETIQNQEFVVSLSYLEVYNEKLIDLIATAENPQLAQTKDITIVERADGMLELRNLDVRRMTTPEDVYKVIELDLDEDDCFIRLWAVGCSEMGERVRHTAGTALNERSSRSHTIIRLRIESQTNFMMGRDGNENQRRNTTDHSVRVGLLNLVDLAGSEGVSRAQTEGERKREGGNINRSLLALSQVISQLSEQAEEKFRGSQQVGSPRFTSFCLRSAKNKVVVSALDEGHYITAVGCGRNNWIQDVTRFLLCSTLEFARRAKKIRNKVKVNVFWSDDQSDIKKLKGEIRMLKLQLEGMNTQSPCDTTLKLQVVESENVKLKVERNQLEAKMDALQRQIHGSSPFRPRRLPPASTHFGTRGREDSLSGPLTSRQTRRRHSVIGISAEEEGIQYRLEGLGEFLMSANTGERSERIQGVSTPKQSVRKQPQLPISTTQCSACEDFQRQIGRLQEDNSQLGQRVDDLTYVMSLAAKSGNSAESISSPSHSRISSSTNGTALQYRQKDFPLSSGFSHSSSVSPLELLSGRARDSLDTSDAAESFQGGRCSISSLVREAQETNQELGQMQSELQLTNSQDAEVQMDKPMVIESSGSYIHDKPDDGLDVEQANDQAIAETNLKQLEQQNEDLKQRLIISHNQVCELRDAKAHLEYDLEESKTTLDSCKVLEEDLQKKQQQLVAFQHRYDKGILLYNRLQQDNRAIKQQLEMQAMANEEAQAISLRILREEEQKQMTKDESFSKRLKEAEDKRDEFQVHLTDVLKRLDASEENNKEKAEHLITSTTANAGLQAELANLQKIIKEIQQGQEQNLKDTWITERKQWEESLQRVKTEKMAFAEEMEKLKEKVYNAEEDARLQTTKLEKDNERLLDLLRSKDGQILNLQRMHDKLLEEVDGGSQMTQASHDQEALHRASNLTAENETLKQQLEECQEQLSQAESKCTDTDAQLEKIKLEISECQRKGEDMKKKYSSAMKEAEEEKRHEYQRQIEDVSKQLENAREANLTFEADNAVKAKQCDELRRTLQIIEMDMERQQDIRQKREKEALGIILNLKAVENELLLKERNARHEKICAEKNNKYLREQMESLTKEVEVLQEDLKENEKMMCRITQRFEGQKAELQDEVNDTYESMENAFRELQEWSCEKTSQFDLSLYQELECYQSWLSASEAERTWLVDRLLDCLRLASVQQTLLKDRLKLLEESSTREKSVKLNVTALEDLLREKERKEDLAKDEQRRLEREVEKLQAEIEQIYQTSGTSLPKVKRHCIRRVGVEEDGNFLQPEREEGEEQLRMQEVGVNTTEEINLEDKELEGFPPMPGEVLRLRRRVKDQESIIGNLREDCRQLDELQTLRQALVQERNTSSQRLDHIMEELQGAKKNLQSQKKMVDEYESRCTELTAMGKEKECKLEALIYKSTTLQQTCDYMEKELQELRKTTKNRSNHESVSSELQQSEIKDLRKTLEATRNELSRANKTIENLMHQMRSEEDSSFPDYKEQLRLKVKTQAKQIRALQEEVEQRDETLQKILIRGGAGLRGAQTFSSSSSVDLSSSTSTAVQLPPPHPRSSFKSNTAETRFATTTSGGAAAERRRGSVLGDLPPKRLPRESEQLQRIWNIQPQPSNQSPFERRPSSLLPPSENFNYANSSAGRMKPPASEDRSKSSLNRSAEEAEVKAEDDDCRVQ